MLRVVGCITQDHDLRLVVLAGLVCLLATTTSVRLLVCRDDAGTSRHTTRWGAGVATFGIGVWTTHFISMLAYRPSLPVSFDVRLCVLSLGVSIAATAIAFSIVPDARGDNAATVASGLILAAGIGAMHFIGMRSFIVPGVIHYEPGLVVAALALGSACSVAAMALLTRGAVAGSAVLLILAVAFIHFVAMGSITLEPVVGIAIPPLAMPRWELAVASAAGCFLLLALALAASILDQHFTSRLAAEARRFRALADATFEGLLFERGGRIVDANRAFYALAGTDAAGLIGRSLSDLIPGIDSRLAESGNPAEYDVRLPDGSGLPVEILWHTGPDRGERVIAIRDISREKAAEGQIRRMAGHDPLTGLANREWLEQQLHRIFALADRLTIGVAVLYIDLDRFESVNEALGHHGAERILIQIAHRLTATVRESDVIARVGRDEFVVVQPLTEKSPGAVALAERIVTEIALPFTVDDVPVLITASVGVALYPNDGADPRSLLDNALLAVRQAKHDGRGRWRHFEIGMDLLLRRKRSLEHDLRIALNEGQFSLNYQPFVDTATLEIVGYEALLRWDHPERGRIPPVDFIPLAEECGLIVPIGRWVLTTACAEAASWDQPLAISVNLSPAQFLQPGIVATVADVLQQTGLPPKRLELEITEGTLMGDTQNALQILTSLKALGATIAMDDFGTGYSSLSYLRKFPFDKIKIDRSFISDTEDDTEAETIVQAIIAMSRSLRLYVTAEGVETKQQLAMLRALGCNFVQGYLLGRPCSASQLELNTKPRWQIFDNAGPRLVKAPAVRSA